MRGDGKTNYGYEYVCPYTGLIDYIGIGDSKGRTKNDLRMMSHQKGSQNGMLAQKLAILQSEGITPICKKVVEGLTREEICEWEEFRIRELGRLRYGTGPLFNVTLDDPAWHYHKRHIKAFGCNYENAAALSSDKRCIVDHEILCQRIEAGCSYEMAATSPMPPLDAFGQRFGCHKDLFKDSRCIVPLETLIVRVCKGELPESAATRPLEWVGAWGQRFSSLQEMCDDPRCICAYDYLTAEVKRGCEYQSAAVSGIGPVRFRNRIYANIHALVNSPDCVVSCGLLLNRMRQHNWTVERAVTEPPEYYEMFGAKFKNVRELSEHPYSKYDEATVLKHLKEGSEPESAIGAWTPGHTERLSYIIEEVIEAAEAEKMELIEAKQKGWTLKTPEGNVLNRLEMENLGRMG